MPFCRLTSLIATSSSCGTHSAWEQKPGVFGHLQPRLTASYGDEGITYRYSGTENKALPWTATLLEIKRKIEAVQGEYNYCLLNRYRSGSDSVGMHADNEPEMGNVIGSLVLGSHTDVSDSAQQDRKRRGRFRSAMARSSSWRERCSSSGSTKFRRPRRTLARGST